MSEEIIRIIASPVFERNIRALLKKYRNAREDIFPIIERLQAGEMPGEQVTGIGYPVYKVRIRNTNTQKGKSGGYRLIYYIKTTTTILLLTLYSKLEQDDVTAEDLRDIITAYDRSTASDSEP